MSSSLLPSTSWPLVIYEIPVSLATTVINSETKRGELLATESFRVLLPLLRHVMPLNGGTCRLTMLVGKGRCAHDVLPHTFNIGVFRSVKNNSATIKHIYNEYGNIIKGCNVAFGASDFHKLCASDWRVWWHALTFVTRDYLTLGICSLIRHTAMEKLMPFPAKIHTVML